MSEEVLKLSTVIFDMDGTLVDSEPMYDELFSRWLKGHDIHDHDKILTDVLGASWLGVYEYIETNYSLGINPQAEADAMSETIIDHIMEVGVPMMDNAQYALDQLQQKFTLALVSSSPRSVVERMLKHHGIYDTFAHVTSVDDVQYPKPHPQPYAMTMAFLGVDPQECVVVEDSLNGVKSGAASGAFVYAMPDPRMPLAQYHEHAKVVHTFDELLKDLL